MALREINLVPTDILNKYHLRRHLLFWAGCLLAVCVMVSGFHFYQTSIALAQKSPSAGLEDTDKKLASKMDEIKKLRVELDTLHQEKANLEKLNKGPAYSYILSRLVLIINKFTWLTQLTLDRKAQEGNDLLLRINGFSSRNEALGDFLNRLSGEPLFRSVLLKYAREINNASEMEANPQDLIQFQIDCNVQRESVS
ncbi:PilN domain-containing protein [Thermodesulfobacteriota bacterium]